MTKNFLGILYVVLILLLQGCVSGGYVWSNDSGAKANSRQFTVDHNTCNLDAMKIAIPSPACTTVDKSECSNTGGLGGIIAQSVCESENRGKPDQKCDNTAVKAAKETRESVYASCMALRGWTRAWVSAP